MSARTPLAAAQIIDLSAALLEGGLPDDPAALIDLLGELERLKSAVCAVQADATVAYDAARRSAESGQSVPGRRQGRGVASEVALARRESPHRGETLLGLAKILHSEMPHTRKRLADGTLSEFRAILLVRETVCLSAEHRAFLDEELCADPVALVGVGTRELVARAKRAAYEIDPAAVTRRARNAESDRNVTVRPAPDTMSYLTGLLPVAQGVAVHAALGRDADTLRAQGDLRSRGQLMADLLVARVTGVELVADAPTPVPVTVNHTGRLVGMTSKQRLFADGLGDFVAQRDLGICRTPWCDSPIRHRDHIRPAGGGGETSADNGQGLCEACNHAKQAPGWRQQAVDDQRHTVETITPTGHRYLSHAPPPVGWREPRWVRELITGQPGVYTLVA